MNNKKQQTAVQNLCMKLANKLGIPQAITFYVDYEQEILEALEMEKEQMMEFALAVLMEAYATVEGNVTTELTIQEYYNLKYGK
jgi:hypothetical protein